MVLRLLSICLWLIVFVGPPAHEAAAQSPSLPAPPFERPGDRLAEEPLPPILEEDAPSILPPIPEPSLGEIQGDEPGEGVLVRAVEIRGNTAIETQVLGEAIEPFLGQTLAAEGIEALRRELTEVYVNAGYVNSGAVIPAQELVDGRLVVAIVEGRLTDIRLVGLDHYRDGVIRARIERGIEAPLNIKDIEQQIRLLDQDSRIEQINARLRPGTSRGEAILEVSILEASPWQLEVAVDNFESPSVGEYAGRVAASYANVLGFGDRFAVQLEQTEGLTRVDAFYNLPIHPSGTRLVLDGSFGYAQPIDNLLERLDVETSDYSVAIGLAQTLWHTPADRVDVSLSFERRRSKTELLGRGFSFVDGPQSGRSEISVVRAVGEWTHRGRSSVFALRSMFSFGTDWLNPTTQSGDTPDGVFFSWYGQARGVYRLPRSGIEFIFRGDVQLSAQPLLSLEQFAVGGPDSVRGYRRNQLVRDQGFTTALDVRFPIWRAADARTVVALSPFADVGYSWNQNRPSPGVNTLSGLGARLEWFPLPQLDFMLEYAHGFRNTGFSNDLQDESIYFRASWRIF